MGEVGRSMLVEGVAVAESVCTVIHFSVLTTNKMLLPLGVRLAWYVRSIHLSSCAMLGPLREDSSSRERAILALSASTTTFWSRPSSPDLNNSMATDVGQAGSSQSRSTDAMSQAADAMSLAAKLSVLEIAAPKMESPFLRLPAELRNRIYSEHFSTTPIPLDSYLDPDL